MASNGYTEPGGRGFTIVTSTGRDIEKPIKGTSDEQSMKGKEMAGGPRDLSRSIKDGQVPTEKR